MTNATVSLSAGRLLWKHIRNYVGAQNAKGASLSLWEGQGLLERPFVISGPTDQLKKVRRDLDHWLKEINAQ